MSIVMEIVFFIARPDEASGVASSHDLLVDVAAEPIQADGLSSLIALGDLIDPASPPAFRPVRDATCRSYPVWSVPGALCNGLAALDDDQIEALADRWVPHPDSDPFDRSNSLGALRDALRERAAGESLFALLEERAF